MYVRVVESALVGPDGVLRALDGFGLPKVRLLRALAANGGLLTGNGDLESEVSVGAAEPVRLLETVLNLKTTILTINYLRLDLQ